MTDQTDHPCTAAMMHRLGSTSAAHGPHHWTVQPGMEPVHCPGTEPPTSDQTERRARCTCGETACESEQCDCDDTPCPVDHAGYDHGFCSEYGVDPETDGFVDAVLAVLPPPADRAAVLRWAADYLDNSERLRDYTDDHMSDINKAANELRRLADEARQQPGSDVGTEFVRQIDHPDMAGLDAVDADLVAETPTEEQIVRDHVTSLHLIGEQLADIEFWMWEHLAHVRNTKPAVVEPAEAVGTETDGEGR